MVSSRVSDYLVLAASVRMQWLRPRERRVLWRQIMTIDDDTRARRFIADSEEIVKQIRSVGRPIRVLQTALREALMRVPP